MSSAGRSPEDLSEERLQEAIKRREHDLESAGLTSDQVSELLELVESGDPEGFRARFNHLANETNEDLTRVAAEVLKLGYDIFVAEADSEEEKENERRKLRAFAQKMGMNLEKLFETP